MTAEAPFALSARQALPRVAPWFLTGSRGKREQGIGNRESATGWIPFFWFTKNDRLTISPLNLAIWFNFTGRLAPRNPCGGVIVPFPLDFLLSVTTEPTIAAVSESLLALPGRAILVLCDPSLTRSCTIGRELEQERKASRSSLSADTQISHRPLGRA